MFTCPKLQAALEKTKSSFDSGSDYMNAISGDILNLEKFIAVYPLPCSISIDIENTVLSYSQAIEYPWFGKFDAMLAGDLYLVAEKIAWDNERKRLCHIVCVSKASSEHEYYDGSKRYYPPLFLYEEMSNKPLMECKFIIKKKAHPHLSKLLESAAKEFGYKEKPPRLDPAFDDEIPF